MAQKANLVDIQGKRYLYAANLLADLAGQAARLDQSASGWDQCEGFIDPTNTNRNSDLTSEAYVKFYYTLSDVIGATNIKVGLEIHSLQPKKRRFEWFHKIPFNVQSKRAFSQVGKVSNWLDLPTYSLIVDDFSTKPTEVSDEIDNLQLLYQEFEDEVSKLEQDISTSIRDTVRDSLKFLLNANVQEHDGEQEPLRIRSIRGLYRFLALTQCSVMPSLSLTVNGSVYARWRHSASRSIGALFVDGSRVNYALRNLPKRHSGSSSPTEFWTLIRTLKFDDMVRPS